MRIAGIKEGSTVDGLGIRISIFLSGCFHNCDGCHNTLFQNPDYGQEMSYDEINEIIKKNLHLIDGITFSGGDPLYQYSNLINYLRQLRTNDTLKHLNIWLYTGFTFDKIPESIKKYVDVIVDGKYEKDKPPAMWRGSNNQKIYYKIKDYWVEHHGI